MRLTLRTLLAYLDDILDPADKEELNKKIESSEFAGDLILRTRDTMRRLRLSAPQVVGTGMGLDPNTVAEYLDNALPPDQVGDFERICLESDMHLAEVASAHHVLTMVLGSPADVEPAARARMYSIPQQVDERKRRHFERAHPTVGAAAGANAALPTMMVDNRGAAPTHHASEVPEYLRTSAWSRYSGLIIAVAALLLVGVTILFSSGVTDWFGGNQQTAGRTPVTEPNGSTGGTDVADTTMGAESVDIEEATQGAEQVTSEETPVASDAANPSLEMPSESAMSEPLASPPAPYTPGVAPITTVPAVSVDPYASTAVDPSSATASDLAPRDAAPPADATTPPAEPVTGADPTATTPDDLAPTTPNPFMPILPDAAVQGESPFVPLGPTAARQEGIDVPSVADSMPSATVPEDVTADIPGQTPEPGDRYALPTPPAATLPSDPNALTDEAPITPAPTTDAEAGDPSMRVADRGSIEGTLADASAVEDLVDPAKIEDTAVEEQLPDLGTYLGGKTVLLRWDDSSGAWFRVSPRSAVMAGDRLLALPEFRPKLTFGSGIHMDLSGGTRVMIDRATAQDSADLPAARADVPKIDVVYGRVVLLNTAEGNNSVRLVFGSNTVDVELERNATLGVEVERVFVPGHDPRKTAAPIAVTLYAPDGGIVWHDATGEKQIEEPAEWMIADGETSELTLNPTLPEWIDHEPLEHRSEQLYGAPVVEETLTTKSPAGDQLLELFVGGERKRKEVKSLSARSSIHVGLFVPFVEALRDSQQRPNWENHIETLRAAMSLDPEAAESIWQTLVDQRGEAAARDLYEMLCGYSAEQVGDTPEEVQAGVLPDLIDHLENDSLDYRVLAVQNLADLTGKRLMRNPAANASERSQNLRQWRRRLESGELVRRE